jgi:hypothetical protein
MLRRIFGPTKEDDVIWRTEAKKELDEPIKHRDIINCVKAQRLIWVGHINRMSEYCKANIQMETIYKQTSRKAKVQSRWEDGGWNDVKRRNL